MRFMPFSASLSRKPRLPAFMLVWSVLLLLPPVLQVDASSQLALAVLKLGNSSAPHPGIMWTWGYRLLDPQLPFNPYACTDQPSIHYCGAPCGSSELGMNLCIPTIPGDCERCGGNCPAKGEKGTQFTGFREFPLRCLRVVEAVEDQWTPLNVMLKSILTKAEEEGVGMTVTLTNVYGEFDLYGCNTTLKATLIGSGDKTGWSRLTCPKAIHQARVEYYIAPPPAPQQHTIIIMGSIAMVKQALGELRYRGSANSNSKRLVCAHLDPVSTRFQPYETLSWNVSIGVCQQSKDFKSSPQGDILSGHICDALATVTTPDEKQTLLGEKPVPLPIVHAGSFEMMVHIWELNDPPHISDPQKCHFRAGCAGDIRDVRVKSGGSNYYTEIHSETGPPVRLPPTLVAECATEKCQECVTEKFEATVTISDTGAVTAIHVKKHGKGYVSEFPPQLVFKGKGAGRGAELQFDIGASLFEPCPFPQASQGVEGFPDEAMAAENCEPEPECSAGSAFPLPATFPLPVLEYYFGQYWRYEDRAEPLSIGGIQITDLDLTETCTYLRPYCTLLDVQVRAQQGSLLLNRRQNLAVYEEKRTSLAWNSPQESANMAVKVLLYQTELPALLTPASTALNYNSQVLGGRDEFVVVTAKDQGFTGYDGVSACYKGGDHAGLGFGTELSCGLRLNVTIVAVNDPPEILTPEGTMLEASENKQFILSMLCVRDTDVDEKTTSLLALDDWTGRKEYDPYLNRMRIRLQVIKGHILLSPTARDISLTGNSSQLWWVLSRFMQGHDLCRATKCFELPASCLPGYNKATSLGVSYQDVCSFFETTPELIPFGLSSCVDKARCQCQVDNACAKDSDISLYLNRSAPQVETYIDELVKALDTFDATCGGLPHFGAQSLKMSYGKPCRTDTECRPPLSPGAPGLRQCTPGVDCFCCANVSMVCNVDDDCSDFGLFSICGCQRSNPTDPRAALIVPCGHRLGEKPCFCCNDMTIMCSSHSHCGAQAVGSKLANVSYCGCRPGEGICGPFGQGPNRNNEPNSYTGDPSLFLAMQVFGQTVWTEPAKLTGGSPCIYVASSRCLPPNILTEGTAKPAFISQMQQAGSSLIEFYGPMTQTSNALSTSYYLTSNPSYTSYNKRYRTPPKDRPSSFNILESDEDLLTFTAMDMGNSGGTKRRCMLCKQHCLCKADCSGCIDCGRKHRAGCYDQKSFVVSVAAVNDPPKLTGPKEIWAVEGMPYSFINTDVYELFGGTLRLREGSSTIMTERPPHPIRQHSEMTCDDDGCKKVWLGSVTDPETDKTTYQMRANGIGITDPDTKDYGFDNRIIRVKLNCSHGRLFVSERFLEEILFNGDLECDPLTAPELSELGCRIRLVDVGHEQGNVGLYAQKRGPFSEMSTCGSLVKYEVNEVPQPGGTTKKIETRKILSDRKVPSVSISSSTKQWGCPCYSNVLFNNVGQSWGEMSHCTKPLSFNRKMPLLSGESVPLVGNRFIALEGRLRFVSQAIANITYLPDPYFNTRNPGITDEIFIEVDDQGGIGDALKDSKGQVIPPTPLKDSKTIKVNVEAVNDAPKIGRRVVPACQEKYADRKMHCPLGVNDPLATNLQRIESWTQVQNWPDDNIITETLVVPLNASLDYIDVDEDSIFAITPDVLWVIDRDSAEADTIFRERCVSEPHTRIALKCESDPACKIICEDPFGMKLVNSYRCDGGTNDQKKCVAGAATVCGEHACKLGMGHVLRTQSNPGELIVELTVSRGKLSFYPPPPQFPTTLAPAYTVLTNMTPGCRPSAPSCKYLFESCIGAPGIKEFDCLFNVSHLWIRTTLKELQFALVNKYITYVSDLNFFGTDTLEIFVSDQGYTSDQYDVSKSASQSIRINIVPINNPPVIKPPQRINAEGKSVGSVLPHQRGVFCRTSYMDYAGTRGTLCRSPGTSKVPPFGQDPIMFSDVDLDSITRACPATCGNVTLMMTFERPNSGAFRFFPTVSTLQVEEFIGLSQSRTLVISGRIRDLNSMMNNIYFDTDDVYTGYAPVTIIANDNYNYGQCDRDVLCSIYDELGVQTTPCTRDRRRPCISPIPGIGKYTIDFVIGAMQTCKYKTCEVCNRDLKCGWCPTTCKGVGKCMIQKGPMPKFEICESGVAWVNTSWEANVSRHVSFGLCKPKRINLPLVIAGSILGFFAFASLMYYTIRLIIVRYGTLAVYLRKKRFNFIYTGRKMHILPPPGANYIGFFVNLIVPLVVGVVASGVLAFEDSPYHFKNAFYLDDAAKVTLRLDNCAVRFLPRVNFPAPDNELDAVKIRFAYPNSPLIMLTSFTCGEDMEMELVNDKSDETKYLDYWCSVEIITPERTVLPGLHIIAKGDNQTSVRGGPMDSDTRNYGLDFGPNTLRIEGNYVNARLQNMTMKYFVFKVHSGSLLAVDLGSLEGLVPVADISSHDADIIVTTRRMTSLRVWQKSNNYVCITAANQSLYIDSNCQEVCDFIKPDPNAKEEPIDPSILVEDSESPCPNLPEPLVEGCYDPKTCTLIPTQLCFCKPTCEAPYSKVNGTCSEDGKCCREVCSGFTFADIFPEPSKPRCGACVDSVAMPWTKGNLEQQWKIKSERGQISIQCLAKPNMYSVSSFKLDLVAKSRVDVPIEFSEDSKIVLDSVFHPGGASQPLQPWFEVTVQGPGAPESSYGTYVWVRFIRFLVIPEWLVSLFSLKLLAPGKTLAQLVLKPGFCPGYIETDTNLFGERLVKMFLKIQDAMENYPPNAQSRKLPFGSYIVAIPVFGGPKQFQLDTETNQFAMQKVLTADFPDMMTALYVSIGLPLIVAFILTVLIALNCRNKIAVFRVEKCYEEAVLEDLATCIRLSRGKEEKRGLLLENIETKSISKEVSMQARTNVFFLVHAAFGLTDVMLSPVMFILCTVRDVTVLGGPAVIVIYCAFLVKESLVKGKCLSRLDKYVCEAEMEPISFSALLLCLVYTLLAVAELAGHLLKLPYNKVRRVIRHLVYGLLFILSFFSMFLLGCVICWLVLGVLIDPPRVMPYLIAIITMTCVGLATWAKSMRLRDRTDTVIRQRLKVFYESPNDEFLKGLPRIVFRVLVEQQLHVALQAANLSFARTGTKALLATALTYLQIHFLFVGFNAFTDPTSMSAACLNSAFILILGAANLAIFGDDGDREGSKDQVQGLFDSIAQGIQRVLSLAAIQIAAADRVMEATMVEEEWDSSSSSSNSSNTSGSEEEEEEEEGSKRPKR